MSTARLHEKVFPVRRALIAPALAALGFAFLALPHAPGSPAPPAAAPTPLPTILFVTQPPYAGDFGTVNSVFGNHRGPTQDAPRGGDLYIRYTDGSLRNLTAEAGFGLQIGKEIAVREPTVHWGGAKAIFSMVIGGTTPGDGTPVYWQIYEVTGLGKGSVAKITKLPQPEGYNNVSPFYGTDERILFTSDRPRNGDPATFPQLDEYESDETVTGIWSMNRKGGELKLLDHAPSGDFTPIIDSAGRIIFIRWDHLQRDQQNEPSLGSFGPFNYQGELSPVALPTNLELFPEPIFEVPGSGEFGHNFNFFFPWQMNEDGSGLETLNHVGRHELMAFAGAAKPQFFNFYKDGANNLSGLFLHIKEDPKSLGTYLGTTCQEFYTHGAGQIVSVNGGVDVNADDMGVTYLTDPMTRMATLDGQQPPPNHPGHFRNPVPLSNGALVAVRTTSPFKNKQTGPGQFDVLYDFHLSRLEKQGQYWVPVEKLNPNGIVKSVSYWDNWVYQQVSYNGPMWELDPVEVRARPKKKHKDPFPDIETQIVNEELGGTSGMNRLRNYLKAHRLAMLVSRDVTRRADKQQEFNLKIAGSSTQTAVQGSTPEEIAFIQFLQGDLIRGYTNHNFGRRPLAQWMHNGNNPPVAGAPKGGVKLGPDGSMAAFLPARRALTWQITAADSTPVIKERYWVTFAPGEMRTCANCHGINKVDVVLGLPKPTNPPQALHTLLSWYRSNTGNGTIGDTVGVYMPGGASFTLRNSNTVGSPDANFVMQGIGPSWIPITGDWDGDGIDTVGFYDPAASVFHLRNSNSSGPDDVTFAFGTAGAGWLPIVGDWDEDGVDSVGLYDPATATFRLKYFNESGAADATFVFGPTGSVPVAGDWNGDGRDTIGVWIPSTGEWRLRNSNSAGAADATFVFTATGAGWLPIAGDWDTNGLATPGLYQPATGQFILRKTNLKTSGTAKFNFGPVPGGLPLAGDWNGK